MDNKINAIAQSIAQQYGRAIFSAGEALKIVGLGGADPANVARQLIYRGTYPFSVAKIGGRNCVTAIDIAAKFAKKNANEDNLDAPVIRRGRGRPRKIAGGDI
jgi:hypothetical protein